MKKDNPERLLRQGCRQLGVELPREALENLAWYCGELRRWNSKINLIARADLEEIIDRHFLDSLAVLAVMDDLKDRKMMDLGTGAGFPGLALKIALPSLQLLLVEARLKKTAFLRHIIRNLGLREVEVLAARLEAAAPADREKAYPLIISRAFASISSFLALIREYSPPGGRVICMKGPRADQEIEEWEKAQPDSPFRIHLTHRYHLPFSGAERSLIIFRKSQ